MLTLALPPAEIMNSVLSPGINFEFSKIFELLLRKAISSIGLKKNRLISLCMPCKINVLEEDGKVKIAGMKPTMISEFFPEVSKEEAEEVERDVKEIVDNAR